MFLGISTSGNSKNVKSATVVARAIGLKVIGLTGLKVESWQMLQTLLLRCQRQRRI